MGMRIGGSNNAWASQQSSSAINWQQRHQNFKSLKSALQSNDLAGAQQAFAALSASNPQAASNPSSPLAQLGQALQAGNMPAAQQVAQNWQNNQQNKTGNTPSVGADAALASFLQTLNTSQVQTSTSATTPTDAGTTPAPTANSPQQVAQALLAFEKNLFDSLQLQNKTQDAGTSPSTPGTSTALSDHGMLATNSNAPAPPINATPGQEHHHRHHQGGGGSQLNSELNALIAQNSQNTDPNVAANSTSGLDQSFKSLLNTLGVSGNNASLNSFLQAMSSNMQSSQAQA